VQHVGAFDLSVEVWEALAPPGGFPIHFWSDLIRIELQQAQGLTPFEVCVEGPWELVLFTEVHESLFLKGLGP
jgi:hypothetical protein